jgi:hypothetical protein
VITSTGELEKLEDARLAEVYTEVTGGSAAGVSRQSMIDCILATLYHRQQGKPQAKSDYGRVKVARFDWDPKAPDWRKPWCLQPVKVTLSPPLTALDEFVLRRLAKGVTFDELRQDAKRTFEGVKCQLYRLRLTHGFGYVETPSGLIYLLRP